MARSSDAADPRQISAVGPQAAPTRPAGGRSSEGRRQLDIPVRSLNGSVGVALWSPADISGETPVPLLVVHDGPDYAARAGLTRYLGAGVGTGWLPPNRAALLDPGSNRNRWYSANPRYTNAVRRTVIPALSRRTATTTRVGIGTSLGALAILAVHRRDPAAFDAMFLQSGSFFHPRFDAHERRFPYYDRIVGFVASVFSTSSARPIRTILTCSATEENIHNNRLMTEALRSQGYDVTLYETPGGHDWPAWRDGLHLYLTELLSALPGEIPADETRRR